MKKRPMARYAAKRMFAPVIRIADAIRYPGVITIECAPTGTGTRDSMRLDNSWEGYLAARINPTSAIVPTQNVDYKGTHTQLRIVINTRR